MSVSLSLMDSSGSSGRKGFEAGSVTVIATIVIIGLMFCPVGLTV
jgi:hypothetical protein